MSALPGSPLSASTPPLSADASWSRHAATALAAILLALPWLVAWTPGPSNNLVPWLLSAGCGVLAWAMTRPAAGGPFLRVFVGAALLAVFALLRAPGALDAAAFAGAILLMLVAASFAAGRLHTGGGDPAVPIAWAWLLAAALSAGVGLLQFFGLAEGWQPWLHPAAPGEAIGQVRQRNQLASLTAIGLASALWLLPAVSAGRSTMRAAGLAGAVVLLAAANAATTSRTGLLAWLVLTGLVALWAHPARGRRLALCGLGLLAYAAATLALPPALHAATGLEMPTLFTRVAGDLGCSSRRVLWDNVLHLVAERPLLGWGWGELDYAHYATLYGGARFCDILDNAHNLPLHLAVELGLPAAVLACAALAWAVLRARPWREAAPNRQLAWAVLAVIGLHSLLEYPLWYGPFQLTAGLAIGLLLRPAGVPAPLLPRALPPALALLLFAALAYAAWDYRRVSQVYRSPEERVAAWRDDALGHAQRSWLFAGQARFAAVTLAPVTAANAEWLWRESEAALHYSPEPRVIEKALESAALLGRPEALLHLARYEAAFPQSYATWRAARP